VHLYLVVHPWLFSLSARLHLGYKHVTGCNPVLHSLRPFFPPSPRNCNTSIILCLRSTGPGFDMPVPLFLFSRTLKRCQLAIKKSLNQLMQCADLAMPSSTLSTSTGCRAHCPCGSPFHVPVSWLLLLSQVVFHKEQEFLRRFGLSAVARASWLMAAHPPPPFLLSLGTFLWVPCS